MSMGGKIIAGIFGLILFIMIVSSLSGSDADQPLTAEESAQQAQELAEWQKTPAGELCVKHPD